MCPGPPAYSGQHCAALPSLFLSLCCPSELPGIWRFIGFCSPGHDGSAVSPRTPGQGSAQTAGVCYGVSAHSCEMAPDHPALPAGVYFPQGLSIPLHPFLLSISTSSTSPQLGKSPQPQLQPSSFWVGGCRGEASGPCSLTGVFSVWGQGGIPSSATGLSFPSGAGSVVGYVPLLLWLLLAKLGT